MKHKSGATLAGVFNKNFITFCSYILYLFFISATCVFASDHLLPLSALHFNEPSFETETFNMPERTFLGKKDALQKEMNAIYGHLIKTLPNKDAKEKLIAAQESWLKFFSLYEAVLKKQLDHRVKVFYGVENKERKTNIYRDTVLILLEQRVMDLYRWIDANYGHLKIDLSEEVLEKKVNLVNVAISYNLYTMDEKFRISTMQARDAWFNFLQTSREFVETATNKDQNKGLNETYLQALRMYNLTLLHTEGSIFFHTEREE